MIMIIMMVMTMRMIMIIMMVMTMRMIMIIMMVMTMRMIMIIMMMMTMRMIMIIMMMMTMRMIMKDKLSVKKKRLTPVYQALHAVHKTFTNVYRYCGNRIMNLINSLSALNVDNSKCII